ncbi:MAG: ATP-binding protein [Pseudomonadota bacterium]
MTFDWLKRYMPSGLYPRAALILMLPVVIIQLVVTVVFAQRHFEGVTNQMSTSVLRELALVRQAIEEAPRREAVPEIVEEELAALEMRVLPIADDEIPDANRMVWYDYSGRVLVGRFLLDLPGFEAIDLTNSRALRLFLQTDKGPFEIQFERRRVSASNPHQLFVYTIFFGVVMTVIAFIYLRNQLRPITRLAEVAAAFGRGRHVPFSPAGAAEVRSAGHAFLDMRSRIERHIEQRTLMLSGVSHDLRTPLTRMRLSLSMLDEPEAAALMDDVDDMQRMLDEFLEFTKGASESTPEEVDPHALLSQIVDDARRAGRAVTLLEPDGGGTGTVMLHKSAIRRAIDNLISNAVRYGAEAEVSLLFTDKTLRIRVEDNGPGIHEERRDEATRAFTRLDPARNQDKGGGVGLGLAIATDIARAHGGVLRLGESARLSGLRADIVIAR